MAFLGFGKKEQYKPIIGILDSDKVINQAFKGEVFDKPVKFPKELGSEHPFKFDDAEKVYSKVGYEVYTTYEMVGIERNQ